MPEMTVSVRWPDGREEDCYSPSLVMHDHLESGRSYTVAEFSAHAEAALHEASERVRAKYGFACSSAAASLARIRASAAGFGPGTTVEVLRMWPPLPQADPPAAPTTAATTEQPDSVGPR